MSNDANLSGFQKDRYFGRAWAMLTQEKGWWKPILLCALGALVPIVGPLAVLGYGLEWSRRVAWGSTEGPSRQVKIGGLIKSGWRGFVVVAGWSIAAVIVGSIVENLPWIGDFLGSVWGIFTLFLGVVFVVAEVRATIYQNFKAGYRAKTLWQMVSRDPWGLLRVFVIKLVPTLIVGVVGFLMFVPAMFGSLGFIAELVDYMDSYYYYMTDAEAVRLALEVVGFFVEQFAPAFFVTLVVALAANAFVNLLVDCSVGLWLRQFDVPAWGKDEDPLPETSVAEVAAPELPESPTPAPPAPAAPVAPVAPVSPSPEPAAPVVPVAPVVSAPAAAEPPAAETVPAATEPAPASIDAKKTCDACGSELPENAKFCIECGAPVAAPQAEVAPEPVAEPEVPAEDAADSDPLPDEPPVPGTEDEKDGEAADEDSDVIMVTPIAVAPVDVLSQNREDMQQQSADMQSEPSETSEEQ